MKQLALISGLFLFFHLNAQPGTDFRFYFEPVSVPDFPGVQSAAFGYLDEQIVLFGGRTDGLHRRQPFAAFQPTGANLNISVLLPASNQYWSAPISGLPAGISEQLQATNLQFAQDGPWLYLIGGYGFSTSANDHITHPVCTAVRLDSLIHAVQTNQPVAPWFLQITDDRFAVSGGQLGMLDGIFYLVGGHKFTGRYNPMNHPTFTQTYTNEIRRFTLSNDGATLSAEFLPSWNDPLQLHRRDYSMANQVFPDGRKGFTAFSGVFQQFVDLPYLNSVDVDSAGHTANNNFQHRLNQYHCAHTQLYDAGANRMYTVFFGGIAQYYFNGDTLVQDDNVPFVKTIGRVTRRADGSMIEEKIGELPGYLGAGAEFIPANESLLLERDIFDLNAIQSDTVFLGYIIGGIESEQANIFFNNQDLSVASNKVWGAYWIRNTTTDAITVPPYQSLATKVHALPNPAHDHTRLNFTLAEDAHIDLVLQTPDGRTALQQDFGRMRAGEQNIDLQLDNFPKGIYTATLTVGQEQIMVKIAVH